MVYNNSGELFSRLQRTKFVNPVFLLMSSGDFDGIDFFSLSEDLLKDK